MASSGLKHEVKIVASIVNATGGTYIETLGRTASVLIINPEDADWQKPIYALKHRISVVSLAWFLQTLAMGRPQPYAEHKIPDSAWKQYEHAKDREMDRVGHHAENTAQHTSNAVEQVKR